MQVHFHNPPRRRSFQQVDDLFDFVMVTSNNKMRVLGQDRARPKGVIVLTASTRKALGDGGRLLTIELNGRVFERSSCGIAGRNLCCAKFAEAATLQSLGRWTETQ